jgi:hypothetical protein
MRIEPETSSAASVPRRKDRLDLNQANNEVIRLAGAQLSQVVSRSEVIFPWGCRQARKGAHEFSSRGSSEWRAL